MTKLVSELMNSTSHLVYAPFGPGGGTLKTTTMHIGAMAHDALGIKCDLAECDPANPFASIYPGRVQSYAVGPEAVELMKNPELAVKFFTPVLTRFVNPPRPQIIDLGSPMSKPLIAIAKAVRLPERMKNGGAHLRLSVNTTTDAPAFEAAVGVYDELRELFPEAYIAFVVGERQGPVSLLTKSEDFKRISNAGKTRLVVIPRCPSPLFASLYGNLRIGFDRIFRMDLASIMKHTGEDEFSAPFYSDLFRGWLKDTRAAFGDFFPYPREAP